MQEVGFPDITTSNHGIAPETTSDSPEGNKYEPIKIPKEEAANRLREAKGIIAENLKNGAFDKNPQKKDQAQTAIEYTGTDQPSDQETTKGIKAMVGSLEELRAIDTRAEQSYLEFLKYITVQSGEGDNVEFYSLQGWKKKLDAIQNDTSLSEEDRSHKIESLETKARYGFLLQKEGIQTEGQQKSAEDRLIDDSIGKIKEEIESLRASGQDLRGKDALLAHLELANNAKGELGIFFKTEAFRELKTSGIERINGEEIDRELEELNPRLKRAEDTLRAHLERCSISKDQQKQLMDIVQTGDIEKLITNEHFDKIKGLDQLIFGKEMSESELMKLLSTREKALHLLRGYGKKGLMGILLALLLGAVQAADLAKGEITR